MTIPVIPSKPIYKHPIVPSYQCQQCRKTVSTPTKPSQCSYCGGTQLIAKKNSNSPFLVQSPNRSGTAISPSAPPVRSSKGGMDSPSEPLPLTPPSSNSQRSPNSSTGNYWDVFNPFQLLGRMGLILFVLVPLGYGLYRLGTWPSSNSTQSVVQEDFNDVKNSNWQHPPQSRVENGRLQHHLTTSTTQLSMLKDQTFSDSTVKMEANFNGQTLGKPIAGLATRINGKSGENFYYLLIRSDGAIAMGKRNSSGWQNKIDWVKNSASSSSTESKRLELIAQGDEITGVINGQKIGGFRDSEYKSGKVALISRQDTAAQVDITFDNVMVMFSQGTQGTFSPEQTLLNYYDSFLAQPGVQNLDLVDRVEVYGQKRLKTDYYETLLKVGLRYTFKNGSSLCETRLISFHFDQSQKQWLSHKPQAITLQPNCKL